MSVKTVSLAAAAVLLAASLPAHASVETRSSDAIPSAKAAKSARYAQDVEKKGKAGKGANAGGEAGGGGGGFASLGLPLLGVAAVIGSVIAVAAQNRSN